MTNQVIENERKMEQAFALWKHKTKRTRRTYFTGVIGEQNIVAFYNTHKKNPNEPDIRVYSNDTIAGERVVGDEICSLWANHSEEKDMFYFTGKLTGKNVVGFIYSGDNTKAPYLSVYFKEEKEDTVDCPDEYSDIMKEIDGETGEIKPGTSVFDR